MNFLKFKLILLILVCLNSSVFALLEINSNDSIYSLSPHLYLFVDSNNSLSINDLIAKDINWDKSNDSPIFSLGYSDNVIWAKAKVANFSNAKYFGLTSNTPGIDSITFYHRHKDSDLIDSLVTGRDIFLSDRYYKISTFIQQLKIDPKDTVDFWFRVKTTQLVVFNLAIGEISTQHNSIIIFNIIQWVIYGVFISAFLFTLLFGLINKNQIYTYMSFIVFFHFFYIVQQDGVISLLFQDYLHINNLKLSFTSLILFFPFSILFTQKYTSSKILFPRVHLLANVFIIISVIIFSQIFYASSFIIPLLSFYTTIIFLLIVFLTILSIRKGNLSSKFFLLGWISSAIGAVLSSLSSFNILPLTEISYYKIALLFQIFFFLFGIIHALNQEYHKSKLLDKKLSSKNSSLQKQISDERSRLTEQTLQINSTNTKMHDSIEYANVIQNGINDITDDLYRFFPLNKIMHFPFNPQIDVMTTNFWTKFNSDEILLVMIKQNGITIEGAFQGLLSIFILNEIYETHSDITPIELINKFDENFKYNKHDIKNSLNEVSISVIKWNSKHKTLTYATANQPIYFIDQGSTTKDNFAVLKSSDISIGDDFVPINLNFQKQFSLQVSSLSNLYLVSNSNISSSINEELSNDSSINHSHLISYLKGITRYNTQKQWEVLNNRFQQFSERNKLMYDIDIIGVELPYD